MATTLATHTLKGTNVGTLHPATVQFFRTLLLKRGWWLTTAHTTTTEIWSLMGDDLTTIEADQPVQEAGEGYEPDHHELAPWRSTHPGMCYDHGDEED